MEDLEGPNGTRLRHYRPSGKERPLAVFAHGGTWVIGDLDTYDRTCRRVADACDVEVLAAAMAQQDRGAATDQRHPQGAAALPAGSGSLASAAVSEGRCAGVRRTGRRPVPWRGRCGGTLESKCRKKIGGCVDPRHSRST
ncbi:alpha/beta hydrolase fold domain-containing protein [Streptosporangium amethystogenes]|uniref:alpha/beta hydrolase fold domain-containing protein n=1 Tax=Streptosporangium amethystogenes TaxID=2002 RepID=UPI000A05CD63